MDELESRWTAIRERIRNATLAAKRSPESVTLIAVSKTQPIEKIETLWRLGQRDFGENYAQELATKAEALYARGIKDIRWHFIGHLQTNKVKQVLPWAYAVHSVDSVRLATEMSKRMSAQGPRPPLKVFAEINIDQEESKSGTLPENAPGLCSEIANLPLLELRGLMCIPSASGENHDAFARLRTLEEKCRPATKGDLSMGMTSDFEKAIQEGATHVRVGTAIFGDRILRA